MTWKLVDVEDERRVLLQGGITEESDFKPLLEAAPSPLVIDLGNVDLINSCGVREWINFVREVDKQCDGLYLINCSPPIVRQLNMISNFKGRGVIRSVLAPYYCDGCNHDAMMSIDMEDGADREIKETIPCPKCGEDMEFDDIPDSYLEFADH